MFNCFHVYSHGSCGRTGGGRSVSKAPYPQNHSQPFCKRWQWFNCKLFRYLLLDVQWAHFQHKILHFLIFASSWVFLLMGTFWRSYIEVYIYKYILYWPLQYWRRIQKYFLIFRNHYPWRKCRCLKQRFGFFYSGTMIFLRGLNFFIQTVWKEKHANYFYFNEQSFLECQ